MTTKTLIVMAETEIERAQYLVEQFVGQFEPSYLFLAYHAALPLVLTPELVSYLRTQFLQGEVPWVAETDLLLSNLCRVVGYEQFVMDSDVRAYLIAGMRREPLFGHKRMEDVARLLIHYIRHLSHSNHYISQYSLQTQQWSAMVYLEQERETAVSEIVTSFQNAIISDGDEVEGGAFLVNRFEMVRLSNITQTLASELESYPDLITYANQVGHLLSDTTGEVINSFYQKGLLYQTRSVLGKELPTLRATIGQPIAERPKKSTKMLFNPFIGKAPVGQERSFIGRKDTLHTILKALRNENGNGIVLYGPRRMGKTSLLRHLENWLPKQGNYIPLYFDLQDHASQTLEQVLNDLANSVAEKLNVSIPGNVEPSNFPNWLGQLLKSLPEKTALVLFFDEFDMLGDPKTQQAGSAFLPYLRSNLLELNPQRLHFIFAISRSYEDLSLDMLSVFKAMSSIFVSLYNREETMELIHLSELNNSLQWTKAASEKVWQLTQGHPNLTAMLCLEVWERAYEKEPVSLPIATVTDVDTAISDVLDRSTHMMVWYWNGLPPTERVVASAIAEVGSHGVTRKELVTILSESGARIIVREVEPAPQTLVRWDILESVNEVYRFRVELFRQWIVKYRPFRRVVQEELDQFIRQFIVQHFTSNELETFCFDYFPEVWQEFKRGMALGQKAIMLVEYCRRRKLEPHLLANLATERPTAYQAQLAAPHEAVFITQKHHRDPRQIFISYAHQDAAFAQKLADDLQQDGWSVWIYPVSIQPGETWVDAISRGLQESSVFLLVITEVAVRSKWVKRETNVAIELEHKGEMRFFPLLKEPCHVPALWKGYQWLIFTGNYEEGWHDLQSQLGKPPAIGESQGNNISTRNKKAYSTNFFIAGGTMHSTASSYVQRPADDQLVSALLNGEFCHIFGTRQIGKSSLIARTVHILKSKGIHVAWVDLTAIGITDSPDQWYVGLLTYLQRSLELGLSIEEWWKANQILSPIPRFMNFLEDEILAKIEGRIVIFIDEIDSILRLDFSDNFFGAIRAFFSERAIKPDLNRLTFVVSGVATSSDLIRDTRVSPFNISYGIELQDFTIENARVLGMGLPESGEVILKQIFYWTDGHPYLTQRICKSIVESNKTNWSKEEIDYLVQQLFVDDNLSEVNLQFIHEYTRKHTDKVKLIKLYQQIYEGNHIIDSSGNSIQRQLKLIGLVKTVDGRLVVRNRIYRKVFDKNWIRKNSDPSWYDRLRGR